MEATEEKVEQRSVESQNPDRTESSVDSSFLQLLGLETGVAAGVAGPVVVGRTAPEAELVRTAGRQGEAALPAAASAASGWSAEAAGVTGAAAQSSVTIELSSTESGASLAAGETRTEQVSVRLAVARPAPDRTQQLSSPVSSDTPVVISVPSLSSSMSSSGDMTPVLPSARLTQPAAGDIAIVTTSLQSDPGLAPHSNPHFSQHNFKGNFPQTVSISPTRQQESMELTVPSYSTSTANPDRLGLAAPTPQDTDKTPDQSFLSREAPQTTGGPLNQARTGETGGAGQQEKASRRAEPGPDINDILSGLLNVVGEGLHIATNYVKENNKKKLQEKLDSVETNEEEFIKKNRTRVNNRGPPLLSPIPFEAIPLEAVGRPGARPGVAIPQRPFQTRLPGPAPVRLPGQVVPPQPASGESALDAGLPSQLPTRPGYTPDFTQTGNDDDTEGVETDTTNRGSISLTQPDSTEESPADAVESVATTLMGQKLPTVPTDPFIDLILSELEDSSTPAPATTTTTASPLIEPSFTPPLLVTPPARRPPRPWDGRRPPRPSGRPPRPPWQYKRRPGPPNTRPAARPSPRPSARPTPPLTSAVRPLVFPTRRRQPEVVTGVAIPAANDIIDITVTAQQGFGARKTKKKYPGKFANCK